MPKLTDLPTDVLRLLVNHLDPDSCRKLRLDKRLSRLINEKQFQFAVQIKHWGQEPKQFTGNFSTFFQTMKPSIDEYNSQLAPAVKLMPSRRQLRFAYSWLLLSSLYVAMINYPIVFGLRKILCDHYNIPFFPIMTPVVTSTRACLLVGLLVTLPGLLGAVPPTLTVKRILNNEYEANRIRTIANCRKEKVFIKWL